jgi:DMSO/TMAO reductase YedYZ molybdopterin-dependent catalytic subunit
MIAPYQNGERVMPGNGYPMRLLLSGWEGNMNIKWVRRIQLTEEPGMAFYEARTYAPILPGGKAYRFYFLQEVKSFITNPSPGLALNGPGFYEISGIAYSGNGRVARVMVSADSVKSWAQAELQQPVLSKGFTRFRVPWRWDDGPAVLQSRAWDEAGDALPTRSQLVSAPEKTIANFWPYATTLFDYIRRAMPWQKPRVAHQPGSLRTNSVLLAWRRARAAFAQGGEQSSRPGGRKQAAA